MIPYDENKLQKDLCYLSILENNKRIMNEFSDENLIYEESQSGPQEEPYLAEIRFDLEQFRKYQKNQKKK